MSDFYVSILKIDEIGEDVSFLHTFFVVVAQLSRNLNKM